MTSQPKHDKKSVIAWSFYDFGSSAYHSLILTFVFSTFFTQKIAPDEITGSVLWARGITISALVVALLSPILGAFADAGGLRKRILFVLTSLACIGTASLYGVLPGQATKGIIIFVTTNILVELTSVFYNAFLPDISSNDRIGRISGYGWAFGYVGGLIAILLAMLGFVQPEAPWFGLAKETSQHIRATTLLTGIWFFLFSLPLFIWVKEKKSASKRSILAAGKFALTQLRTTFQEIRSYREIIKLLVARLFYNDGLITIFSFGGIYAAGTFGFDFEEILKFGIWLNITAGLGAFAFGFLDDKIGGKKTIQITNIGLIVATLIAVFANSKALFWLAGTIVGILSGPSQAASRSLLGRFIPEKKKTEFFGFFSFSGKATAFLGPLMFGILTQTFHSQRAGISVVVFLFLIGSLVLNSVDEKKGCL